VGELNLSAASVLRRAASAAYRACRDDDGIKIVSFSGHWTRLALELFDSRDDKEWSLTDCFSFAVMRKHRVAKALTADHHFVQAGFRALLLETLPQEEQGTTS
jgi:predicted nucleic acid-binding protein